MLNKVFVPKKDTVTWDWRILHNESFMICLSHQILFDYQVKIIRWPRHGKGSDGET